MAAGTPLLRIEDLHVEVVGADRAAPGGGGPGASGSREILSGIDLEVPGGEVHALMGRNGSGKSSLSAAIMGHPSYRVTKGRILFRGEDLEGVAPEERARRGIFLAFQYPVAIPGVSVHSLLRQSLKSVAASRGGNGSRADLDPRQFRARVKEKLDSLGVDPSFMTRSVNEGFSGGEKKRLEVLQMAMMEPALAILDETDSGLDVEALKVIAAGVEAMRTPERSMLLITHYHRMLEFVKPDRVHVLMKGRVVRSGGPDLAEEIDRRGYEWILAGTDWEGVEEAPAAG